MKNLYSIIRSGLLATALVNTSALADLSDILSSGKVKIAVPPFAPFGSVGATGEQRATTLMSRSLSRRIWVLSSELVPVVSKQRIPFLETDRVDLVISTMGANPSRAKSINFSSAYAPFYSGIFAPSTVTINGAADLKGKTVGVTSGSLEDLELTSMAPEGQRLSGLATMRPLYPHLHRSKSRY